MKTFIKLMALLLIMAIAGPFFIKGPDGRPLMPWPQWRWSTLASVLASVKHLIQPQPGPASVSNSEDKDKKSTFTKIFKWQDAEGTWHYSDMNTNMSHTSQELYLNPNANVVHLQLPKKTEAEQNKSKVNNQKTLNSSVIPSTIPLSQVPQLVEQAQQVQGLLEERQKQYDQLLDAQK